MPQSQPVTATDTAAAAVEGVAETPAAPEPESKVETAPVAVVAPVATPAPVPVDVDVAVAVAATETSAENGQEQPASQTKQEPIVAVLFPKATLITATTPAPIAAQFIRIPIVAVQAPAPAPVPVENKASLPPGVPTGVPMGVPMAIHNHTAAPPPAPGLGSVSTSNPNMGGPPQTQNQPSNSNSNPNAIISEKADLPVLYVGRIIGKGGEQIRDLQARSSCKIDVDQNVPHGQPRVITYQGPRDKIEFAKQLVGMLCCDNWKNVDLPLGFATRVKLQVPSHVIGKIIGRGGEMIKVSYSYRLQSACVRWSVVESSRGSCNGIVWCALFCFAIVYVYINPHSYSIFLIHIQCTGIAIQKLRQSTSRAQCRGRLGNKNHNSHWKRTFRQESRRND